jgi:hypothetical protein
VQITRGVRRVGAPFVAFLAAWPAQSSFHLGIGMVRAMNRVEFGINTEVIMELCTVISI